MIHMTMMTVGFKRYFCINNDYMYSNVWGLNCGDKSTENYNPTLQFPSAI